MSNSLLIPLYAKKPQRKIAGTDYVAVTMYKSSDGSVREYAVFTADGEASLGMAYWHGPRRFRPTGFYSMNSVSRINEETWPNLATFAEEMARRHGLKD